MGDPPKQPINDFTALYEQAHVSPPLLNQSGNDITTAMRQQFPDLLGDLEFSQGPVKSFDRAAAKLIDGSTGLLDPTKASGVTDLVRGRIIVETPEQIEAIRTFLTNNADELGITNVKDRFAKPSGTHYRDINLSVQLENGHIAEIQINQRDMLAASNYTHDAYEEIDAIEKRAELEGRFLTPEEVTKSRHLEEFIQDVHDRGAAQVEGIDSLLSDDGKARLESDYTQRTQRNPAFEPGVTLNNESKYGRITDAHPNFLDLSEVNGGPGYKALRNDLGITVDGLEINTEELAKLERPRVQWDRANNTVTAASPEVLDDVLSRSGVSRERLSELGISTTYDESLSRTFNPAATDNAPNSQRTNNVNTPNEVIGSAVPDDGVNPQRPTPLDVADTQGLDTKSPTGQSLSGGFNETSRGAPPPTTSLDVAGPPPSQTPSTVASPPPSNTPSTPDVDAGGDSKWSRALQNAGGTGNVLRIGASGGGLGLSAFHLKQQLLGENSTFHRDIQNDAVATEAKIALGLDVTAFALDSVDLTADITRGGLALAKSVGYIDDVANLGRFSTGVSTLSKIGRVAGPVGTAITVITTGIEYNIASETDDGKRAGQAVGSGGGALGGAAIGAGIGVWFFGVGAAPGAAIGGIIGAFAGGYAGGEYLDDDFQEYFDAQTLEEQQSNLERIKGIGENIDRFQDLELEYTQALDKLQEAFEGTDVDTIQEAQTAFETSRIALADHIETTLLSQGELDTLDSVNDFIGEQVEFYNMKEQHLTASGDTEALARLEENRTGLQEAAASIQRLKTLNDLIGEGYGQTQEEATLKAQEQISSIEEMVGDRADTIYSYNAAVVQQSFSETMVGELNNINTAYNDGQTHQALQESGIALMSLIESGELDQETLSAAREDIAALQQKSTQELADITASQSGLLTMTAQQEGLENGVYTAEYTAQNLERLSGYNTQISGLADAYTETSQAIEYTLKEAENSVAINTLESNKITLDQALISQTQELQDDVETALNKDAPDREEIQTQQETTQTLIDSMQQKLTEAVAYETQIKDMLENGIEINGALQPIENEASKQRLLEQLAETATLKQQYTDQIDGLNETVSNADQTLYSRVLSQNTSTVTLDHDGYVSSYNTGDETQSFNSGERPLLVDNDAHIFNSTSGLSDSGIELSLYNGSVITNVGEPYQETKRDDRAQLRTIDDRSDRREARKDERDLAKSLKDKTMDDAVSPNSLIQNVASDTPLSTPESHDQDIIERPEYIEVAISMEKLSAGEILDTLEEQTITDILNDPDTNPEVIEKLKENYSDQIAALTDTNNAQDNVTPNLPELASHNQNPNVTAISL